jgi:hypothetical protein
MNDLDRELVDCYRRTIRNGIGNARDAAELAATLERAREYAEAIVGVLRDELGLLRMQLEFRQIPN